MLWASFIDAAGFVHKFIQPVALDARRDEDAQFLVDGVREIKILRIVQNDAVGHHNFFAGFMDEFLVMSLIRPHHIHQRHHIGRFP